MDSEQFRRMMWESEKRRRDAARRFRAAVESSDIAAMVGVLDSLEDTGAWGLAMRHVAGLNPSPSFRRAFLKLWIEDGHGIRDNTRDDRALLTALRSLLPAYSGPALRLYRGESRFAWKRRRHGMSWTTDLQVARAFALINQNYGGRGVLLSIDAGPEAIIAKVTGSRYRESEFIVDRRRIGRVLVVERLDSKRPL